MSRFAALLAALACTGCGAPEPEAPRGGEPPNIVLIVADDHGYPDFGFMGSEVARTPNLDRLARGGVTFTTAYNTASVCRPSLATLLTGLEPAQWDATEAEFARRFPGSPPVALIRSLPTLPRLLGAHGYASFQSGKHWEGTFEMAGFSDGQKRVHRAGLRDVTAWSGGAASLAIGRATLAPVEAFLDTHRDERFFLWFAPLLPHTPHDAPARYQERYSDTALSGEERRYLANVSWLDDAVGSLVAHLERRGLVERTLVVFLSDNGWQPEAREAGPVFTGGPRGKGSVYELGWRTPLVFSWPGTLPAGRVEAGLVSTLDIVPTLLDYAGAAPPPGLLGRSLRPLLEGAPGPHREAVFGSDRGIRWREPPAAGTAPPDREPVVFRRDARWRYVWDTGSGDDALYDILADPFEQQDLSSHHPDLVARFRDEIATWRSTVESHALPPRP